MFPKPPRGASLPRGPGASGCGRREHLLVFEDFWIVLAGSKIFVFLLKRIESDATNSVWRGNFSYYTEASKQFFSV